MSPLILDHLEAAAYAVGILGALFAFWTKWFGRLLSALWRWVRAIAAAPRRVEEILNEVNKGDESIHASVRRIEAQVCVLSQHQRIMFDDADEAIVETDERGEVVWANRTYLRLMGKTLEEVKGNGWVNVIPPGKRERVFHEWHDAVKEQREYNHFHHAFIDANGHTFYARVETRCVKYRETIVGWIAKIWPVSAEARNQHVNQRNGK